MGKFIYVFTAEDKDILVRNGFILLSSDERNKVYIFAAREDMSFCLTNIDHVETDSLTL